MKRVILSVVAIAAACIVLLDFFVDQETVNRAGSFLVEGAVILAGFAVLLGLLNILSVHTVRVRKRERGWGYSILLMLAVLVMLGLGVGGPGSAPVNWVFRHIYVPLQATIFSLLAFFVASAAYRAFRVRSWETLLLVGVGIVVLLGQVPVGRLIWDQLPVLKDWLLAVPATAGARGILLGVALGSVIAGMRLLLAMDRPYL